MAGPPHTLFTRAILILIVIAQETVTDSLPHQPQSSGVSVRRDESGRVLIFPSPSVPYSSFYSLSGRPCGFLNVDTKEQLPAEGSRIVLTAGLGLAYYTVLQATTRKNAGPAARYDAKRVLGFDQIFFVIFHVD
jgi:hypothetical protein